VLFASTTKAVTEGEHIPLIELDLRCLNSDKQVAARPNSTYNKHVHPLRIRSAVNSMDLS